MGETDREDFLDFLSELSEEDVPYVKSIDSNPVNSTIANSVTFSTLDTRSFMARINSKFDDQFQLVRLNSDEEFQFYIRKLNPLEIEPGWKQVLYLANYYFQLYDSSLLDIRQTETRIDGSPVFVAQVTTPTPVDSPSLIIQSQGLHYMNLVQVSPFEWRVWFVLGEQAGKVMCPNCGSDMWYKRPHKILRCRECEYRTPTFEDHFNQVCPNHHIKKDLTLLKEVIP